MRCAYVTSHPFGWFYIGKCHSTAKIESGTYAGSGAELKRKVYSMANLPFGTYSGDRARFAALCRQQGWTTTIIICDDDENIIRSIERTLINESKMDPFCLNRAGSCLGMNPIHRPGFGILNPALVFEFR